MTSDETQVLDTNALSMVALVRRATTSECSTDLQQSCLPQSAGTSADTDIYNRTQVPAAHGASVVSVSRATASKCSTDLQ